MALATIEGGAAPGRTSDRDKTTHARDTERKRRKTVSLCSRSLDCFPVKVAHEACKALALCLSLSLSVSLSLSFAPVDVIGSTVGTATGLIVASGRVVIRPRLQVCRDYAVVATLRGVVVGAGKVIFLAVLLRCANGTA